MFHGEKNIGVALEASAITNTDKYINILHLCTSGWCERTPHKKQKVKSCSLRTRTCEKGSERGESDWNRCEIWAEFALCPTMSRLWSCGWQVSVSPTGKHSWGSWKRKYNILVQIMVPHFLSWPNHFSFSFTSVTQRVLSSPSTRRSVQFSSVSVCSGHKPHCMPSITASMIPLIVTFAGVSLARGCKQQQPDQHKRLDT